MRGTGDQGGGPVAVFTLENGYELNTGKLGQGGAKFERQAIVGLSSNRYGTVTLGRQYAGAADYLEDFEFGDFEFGDFEAGYFEAGSRPAQTERTSFALRNGTAKMRERRSD
ncbi:porin [Caballeronia udeis]|uniref:Porin n=1 Tax=Caballeronia udeis TaxID=1232866 RepID=A0A158J6Y1_9BURK|nr:porin [Caballeronia udeis]SAL64203.1 porin [Caballeronia udeis]